MNWEAVSALGTILSALVALGIAVWTHVLAEQRNKKSMEKEAIEKIIVPIRKELDSFSMFKWDNWYFRSRWHQLKDKRLEYPLEYFWLNKNMKQSIEDFDRQFSRFDGLNTQLNKTLMEISAGVFRKFLAEQGMAIEITGDGRLMDEDIMHSHWSCVVGGRSGPSVTLYSLVMWEKALKEYLEERKQDPELPNGKISDFKFSVHNSSASIKIELNQEQSENLLSAINKEIRNHPELNEYRKRWQELYHDGSLLIQKIDSWLATE